MTAAAGPGPIAGTRFTSLHEIDALIADPAARVYIQPIGMVSGSDAAHALAWQRALPLTGGPLAFPTARVWARLPDIPSKSLICALITAPELAVWAARRDVTAALLDRITAPRAPFAGLPWAPGDLPAIMAIINVTPDSFSDGGQFADAAAAITHGHVLAQAGAHILDIGGESTRPGAAPVSIEEELRRVLPVVTALAAAGLTVSIDTRHAPVMRAALGAGATLVNDVTALAGDPDSLATVALAGAPVVLMHMRGQPRTMQHAPAYADAPLDIYDVLGTRVAACEAAGISRDRIAVDPGIGFGKGFDHNLQLLAGLGLFQGLGCPVLLGVSRKSFIARIDPDAAPDRRLAGSLAAALAGLNRGAQIIRAHDVAETLQAVRIWRAIGAT